jgi:hypothetical protein
MAPITEDFETKRLVTEISPFGEHPRCPPSIVVALETICLGAVSPSLRCEIRVIRGSIASFRLKKKTANPELSEKISPIRCPVTYAVKQRRR